MKASKLDEIFDKGEEDVLEYFDVAKGYRPNLEPKRVNIDFPTWVVNGLDQEAQRLGVTRQSLVKLWIAERLEARRQGK
ncbi:MULTISPECIES: type II toxin-antitoxin system BrnA family antitoxin [unclassified Neorhizobium]|uniref:type II toxin-antitoxin system BrnA family antitoxin n=1 Tax=unclassified Neorhizobium TaxID=2629175 RepID=UPI001FF12CBA|nr:MULTISPECIES: BrnA antitoxin family protein [unclassified Neorhizobium]MCJ9672680.1 BrnA antitoxin family protein [Neorhizobium sp. SHOUNA12B]MCJ9748158.1 BrnA antitoxin family protein [Neorhizobium sp. SHOUNA12A]